MADQASPKKQLHCNFCGKTQEEVSQIIAGPAVCICDECVSVCNEAIADRQRNVKKGAASGTSHIPSPRQIREHLDQYVIGQEQAKKVLSVAVHNHYKRLAMGGGGADVKLEKSNILVVGPTGTGKTALASALAQVLDVPFTIADATTLTESGYVGEDADSIITKLLIAADYDVERAQRGIIFIDEIDKIARKGDGPSITRDVSGEGVQQALLKLIEGTVANVRSQAGRKNPQETLIPVDTRNILFICGGAFAGLERIVAQRNDQTSMGFGAAVDKPEAKPGDLIAKRTQEDLVQFGMIPEFIGRLPVVATLQDLTEDMLVQIMTEPKNAIVKQYQSMFRHDGVELTFEEDALRAIARQAIEQNTGARGLRTAIENVLLETMYELPDMEGVRGIVIDADVILNGKQPVRVSDPVNDPEPQETDMAA